MPVQPYLFFNGQADQAIEFYKKAVGAEVQMLMRFKDNPDGNAGCPGGATPPPNAVMHAEIAIAGTTILVSDGMASGGAKFDGFALSFTVPNEAAADKAFNALVDGGQVTMPLGKTFFSPRFGMLADRFGVHWMIHVAQEQ
jgi:PhnB protein